MASLQKRSWTNKAGEELTAWRVVYTDQGGKVRTKQFKKHGDAKAFRNTVTATASWRQAAPGGMVAAEG